MVLSTVVTLLLELVVRPWEEDFCEDDEDPPSSGDPKGESALKRPALTTPWRPPPLLPPLPPAELFMISCGVMSWSPLIWRLLAISSTGLRWCFEMVTEPP